MLAVVIVAHVAIAVGCCLYTLKQIVGAGEILVGDVATLAVGLLNQSAVVVKTVCYCTYYGLIAVVGVGNDIAILVIHPLGFCRSPQEFPIALVSDPIIIPYFFT